MILKRNKATSLFLLLSCFISLSLSGQTNAFIITSIEGAESLIGKTIDGKAVKIGPGTVLKSGTKIQVSDGAKLMVFSEDDYAFLGAGEVELNDDLPFEGLDFMSFDAEFPSFLYQNVGTIYEHIWKGQITLNNTLNRGDGWINLNDENSLSGWGSKGGGNEAGWGSKGSGNKAGWGSKGGGNNAGWGMKSPENKAGWGVKGAQNKAGWGSQNPKNKAGWGSKGSGNKAGWGSKGTGNKAGWGSKGGGNKAGWGSKRGSNEAGWTEKEMTILPMNAGGAYQGNTYDLIWREKEKSKEYLICVFDENLELITSERLKTKRISFDTKVLEEGKDYYWQVFAKNKRAISTAVPFTLIPSSDSEFVRGRIDESLVHSNSGAVFKKIYEAILLENEELYMDADQTFKNLMSNHPSNDLVKICYGAFLIRMGQTAKAKNILEKM